MANAHSIFLLLPMRQKLQIRLEEKWALGPESFDEFLMASQVGF